nr:hypothetical protein [Tanacetum cinerariifolium]
MGDKNPRRTLADYSRPCHDGYQNTIDVLDENDLAPLRSDTIRQTIDQAAGGKRRDKNDKESWAQLADLALYDNESLNDLRDFAKSVKAISMPHDAPSASDRHLMELENQVQRMMEAHLAQTKPLQVNKIASSYKFCSGPRDTQYCMENPEQAFVDYASVQGNGIGGKPFATNQGPRTFNEAAHVMTNQTLDGNVPTLSRARKGDQRPHTLPTHPICNNSYFQ